MHFKTALVLCGILQAAATVSASCAANNCLRAVRASAFTTRHGTADCSSYFQVTVTPVTTTLTITTAQTTTTTVEVLQETVSPSKIPAYASACSGHVEYSSACSCIGVTHITTTVAAATTSTPTSPTSTSPTSTSGSATGVPPETYVIVSPSSCPPSTPSGTVIGESEATFAAANGGLTYQQYPNSQYVIQNATSGPLFVDLSSPTSVTISDENGDTLIIYANGTFAAFASNCEIEIVGSWIDASSPSKGKRNDLAIRQSSSFCSDVKSFCNSPVGVAIIAGVTNRFCVAFGIDIGAEIGGGIGFLGNIFGPEVGIPTTILGVVLGTKFSTDICAIGTGLLAFELCNACPDNGSCSFGTLSCNGGPCQDVLSDPNNCGTCGNQCPSGACQNGQCSASTCDGSTCSSLNSCEADCFCFETSSATGFCGPDIPCAPLADCSSSDDCSQGEVCATGTCCGRNVCLGPCSIEVRRSIFGRNLTELYTGGQGPA